MNSKINSEIPEKSLYFCRNTNFILLFLGKFISQMGDAVYNMAVGWYILSITKSAFAMSIYMAVGTGVYVLIGPIGGVIADRLDRKQLLIWMDIIRGIVVALIGALMYFGVQYIWIFYIASAILSICGAIFVPASNAIIPVIVRDEYLNKANSMNSLIQSITSIVGLVSGGVLYSLIGISGIFVFNAVSYTGSGILEAFINISAVTNKYISFGKNNKHVFRELVEGYNYIKSQKGFYILMWFASIVNFVLVPINAVFVPYIFNQILKTNTRNYSYVGTANAIGVLIGGFIMSVLPQKDKANKTLKVGMVSFSILSFLIFISMYMYTVGIIKPGFLITSLIIIFTLFGLSSVIINIPLFTLMQKMIANEMLGRVTALFTTLSMIAMPLGMMVGGVVADVFPMRMLLLASSLLIIFLTFVLYIQKDIQNL